MNNAVFRLENPVNEPVLTYAPGSAERLELQKKLGDLQEDLLEIPLIIGGREVRTGNTGECRPPHDRRRCLARYHKAGPREVAMAIEAAGQARKEWAGTPWHDRAAVLDRQSVVEGKSVDVGGGRMI